jgi:hypothetical protein
MSRHNARVGGHTYYWTGKPCKHGHLCERLTSSAACVCCNRLYVKLHQDSNPGGSNTPTGRESRRQYARKNLDKIKRSTLQRKYGLSPEQIEAMLNVQKGLCKICLVGLTVGGRTRTSLTVDHCHTSGRVRGLLCTRCNKMLGFAVDSTTTLANAIQYLAV